MPRQGFPGDDGAAVEEDGGVNTLTNLQRGMSMLQALRHE